MSEPPPLPPGFAPPWEPLAPHLRRLTLVAMCIGQGMILLDNTIVNVALPAIQRGLAVGPGSLEWTVNAYVLALASLIVLGGNLGDRYGRKRLFLVGMAVFTVLSLACGLARSDAQLVLFRGLQGVGAAIMAPLTLSILIDAYPPEARTGAIGIWASVAGLGFGAGPIVGGVLIHFFGWPAVFWVNVPIGIAGFALTVSAVRESRDASARRLDLVGTILVSLGLFLLTFALIETNVHPWRSAYTLSLIGVAAVALTAFVAWEARAPNPMIPLGLFRNTVFSTANVVYALAYTSLAAVFFFITLYFQNVKGWSAIRTGLSWIPINVPFLTIAPFAGRIVKRFGSARTTGLGLLLAAAASFGLSRLHPASSFADAWPYYLLIGLGYGMLVPAVSAAAMATVSADHSGVGSGILNSSRQIGAAIGLAVLGSISVATADAAWRARLDGLPDAVRAKAAALVQQVAGGDGQAVGAALGPEAIAPAFDAFVSGVSSALTVAGVALVVAAIIAFIGLRSPRATTGKPGGR